MLTKCINLFKIHLLMDYLNINNGIYLKTGETEGMVNLRSEAHYTELSINISDKL